MKSEAAYLPYFHAIFIRLDHLTPTIPKADNSNGMERKLVNEQFIT